MKTILLLLISISLSAQQFAIIPWRVTPTSLCAGDSVKLNYKILTQTQPTAGIATIILRNVGVSAATYTFTKIQLLTRPYESWPAIGADSCRWIKVKVPEDWIGVSCYFFDSPEFPFGTLSDPPPLTTKSPTFCITENYTVSLTGATHTLLCAPVLSPSAITVYSIITTGSQCTALQTFTLIPRNCTVGIEEYGQENPEPVYYNLFGERTVKRANTVLIDGRRKVIYLSEN